MHIDNFLNNLKKFEIQRTEAKHCYDSFDRNILTLKDHNSIIKNNNTFLSFIDLSIPVAKRLNDDKNNNEDNKKNQVENSDSTSRSSFLRILDIELPNVYEKERRTNSTS